VRSLDYLIANKKINTIKLGRKVMVGQGELAKFCRSNHYDLTESAPKAPKPS